MRHQRVKKALKNRNGTTLVEMMVTLLLISIMMAMAASALSAAARIFVRVQKMQYAQSILDTTMTELRTLTLDANGYIKIYAKKNVENTENIAENTGSSSGNTLEFINEDGYAVLLSTDGCESTALYISDRNVGTAKKVKAGRLLTRYYFYNNGTYTYSKNSAPVARAVAEVFGEGFYMKNYLDVEYKIPDGTNEGDILKNITATVTLYSDADRTDVIAQDTETLEFRHDVILKNKVTAKAETDSE